MKFVVTGFGPFPGTPSNPTQRLVEAVARSRGGDGHRDETDAGKAGKGEPLGTGRVPAEDGQGVTVRFDDVLVSVLLETAATAVDDSLATMWADVDAAVGEEEEDVCVLHFGVSGLAKLYHLEEFGYNWAEFRVPDTRGYHAKGEPIVDDGSGMDGPRGGKGEQTTLPLLAVTQIVNERVHGSAAISDDPGRYICNYTLFRSLRACQQHRGCGRRFALFVHVPSGELRSDGENIGFARLLMDAITEAVGTM